MRVCLGNLFLIYCSLSPQGLSSNFREMLVREVALDATGVPLPGETFVAAKESDVVLLGAIDGQYWIGLMFLIFWRQVQVALLSGI